MKIRPFTYFANADYQELWDLQESIRQRMLEDVSDEGQVLAVEHAPVITYGRAEKGQNLLKSAQWLERFEGISIVKSSRGGMATYHGPGQLVVYPVLSLKQLGSSVKCFVHDLEEVMIKICQSFGLYAQRKAGSPGAWIGAKKIGSVGIHVRRNISIHGFSLNVNPNLEHFAYITPCGLSGVEMTSISREKNHTINTADTLPILKIAFKEVFDVDLKAGLVEHKTQHLNSTQNAIG